MEYTSLLATFVPVLALMYLINRNRNTDRASFRHEIEDKFDFMEAKINKLDSEQTLTQSVVEGILKDQDKFERRIESQLSDLNKSVLRLNDLIVDRVLK